MKKLLFFGGMLMAFMFMLMSCGRISSNISENGPNNGNMVVASNDQHQIESTDKSTQVRETANTTQYRTISPTPPTGLEHSQGSVDLLDNNYYDDGVDRLYRLTYYRIPGVISDLVPDDKYMAWADQYFWNKKDEFTEMPLVTFVKHFDIPREDFERAIAKLAILHAENGTGDEEFEVPNADVIYSFDNETINRYYRYE